VREYQLCRRAANFWAAAGLGSVLVIWRASAPGMTAAVAAYQTRQVIVLGVGVLAVLFAGSAAVRDIRRGAQELVLAKARGTAPTLVMARFLACVLSLLTLAGIMLAAAALAQVAFGGGALRIGPYAAALLHSVWPLTLAAALGYSLTSLFGTSLAAGAAAVYWVAVPLARSHIPLALDLTLSQHWPLCALLTGALMALTAALYGFALRSERRSTNRMGIASGVFFAGAALAALGMWSSGYDGLVEPDPVLAAIAGQSATEGRRAPGFWLPDADGKLVGRSDFDGRPVVMAFWGPGAPESARSLSLLAALADRHRASGLAAIAICLDRDAATIGPFGGDAQSDVVVLWDRGRHFGDGLEWSDSPAAVAYGIGSVPAFVLLDRERRLAAWYGYAEDLAQVERAVSRLVGEQ